MNGPGQALIDLARARGTWQVLAGDETPADLHEQLDRHPAARRHFEAFPP
jgi:hypothetical protein